MTTGFGETSLKNMRSFYEEWCDFVNRQPVGDELPPVDETELLAQIRQPLGDEFNWADTTKLVANCDRLQALKHSSVNPYETNCAD